MKRKTILVIEDNEMNMKLVKVLLQRGQFNILEAIDAESGIRLAQEQRPDLILMDVQLPGVDGLSATRIIKEDPVLEGIRVIALTSYAMEGDGKKALEAGCDGYINKPLNTRGFLDTIRKFLQGAGKRTRFVSMIFI
jgi:CheY-like chemotaxis protein